MPATFQSLVTPDRWKTFNEYAKEVSQELEADLKKVIEENAVIKKEARKLLESEFELMRCTEDQLAAAKRLLFDGRVAAVDGNFAVFEMLAGVRAQIGVAVASYKDKKATCVVYVSEQQVNNEETNVIEILRRRKKSEQTISRMVVRAIMFYMERYQALQQAEEWTLFNGQICPQELRTGLGSLQAIEPCLEICAEVIKKKRFAAVIANPSESDIMSLGYALKPGEYFRLCSYKENMQDYLHGNLERGIAPAGLRGNQKRAMEKFADEVAPLVDVGIFRAGEKAYLFHTGHDYFDEAVALVVRDSLFQPIRAYPLLIDYADEKCSKVLKAGDMRRMIEIKLARQNALSFEQDEHKLRRR